MATTLDRILLKAEDDLRRLERMRPTGRAAKLTQQAFIADCDKLAGLKSMCGTMDEEAAIANIRRRMENEPSAEKIVQNMKRRICEDDGYRRPPNKLRTVSVVAGITDTPGSVTVWELLCVAARDAQLDRFGTIDDWDQHADAVQKLEQKMQRYYQRMRDAWHVGDIIIDLHAVSHEERARSLCKVTFKRAPDIGINDNDWPHRLVAHVAAHRELVATIKSEVFLDDKNTDAKPKQKYMQKCAPNQAAA